MERKTCIHCHKSRPISDFYPNRHMRDGHIGTCKYCICKRLREFRAANPEEVHRRDRKKYAENPKRQAAAKAYATAKVGSEAQRRYRAISAKRHPDRRAAPSYVYQEIKAGRLVRPSTCSECGGGGKIHGHHDDYSKPKEVRWLCTECHGLVHRKGY